VDIKTSEKQNYKVRPVEHKLTLSGRSILV